MESPKTLLEAIKYFSDEQVCIDAVAEMRWPDGVIPCPKGCVTDKPYYLKAAKRWKCRHCRHQFSVKQNSIFEDSPISLTKWLPALWLLVNCKNGISSHELAKDLGITQKSAWFLLHRLRLALKDGSWNKRGGSGFGFEADEAFVGGKPANMHHDRRVRIAQAKSELRRSDKGQPFAGKTAVMGMYDRDSREVRAKVVPNIRRETLQKEILENIKTGSHLYTDASTVYTSMKDHYIHETVNHVTEYVRGQVHTNGLENFWALMKRGLNGTYVAVEPYHLDRYVGEQVFRFNYRARKDNPFTDYDRFLIALSQVANKRLTYAELTGKAGERAEN